VQIFPGGPAAGKLKRKGCLKYLFTVFDAPTLKFCYGPGYIADNKLILKREGAGHLISPSTSNITLCKLDLQLVKACRFLLIPSGS